MCSFNDTTIYNKHNLKNKKKTMKRNERIYVMEDENGEPIICDCQDYLEFILRMIKNTPNDNDLGRKLRGEYDTLKLSLLFLFDDDIEDEIPFE